jgi:hypothetical protein
MPSTVKVRSREDLDYRAHKYHDESQGSYNSKTKFRTLSKNLKQHAD